METGGCSASSLVWEAGTHTLMIPQNMAPQFVAFTGIGHPLRHVGGSRAVVLHLWVETPLGVKQSFHRGRISDIYSTIHNSSKLQL